MFRKKSYNAQARAEEEKSKKAETNFLLKEEELTRSIEAYIESAKAAMKARISEKEQVEEQLRRGTIQKHRIVIILSQNATS